MRRYGTPSELSLSQAAREAGVSKSTVHRSIKNGRLSATRHEDGTYSIAPSELFRAFPRNPSGTASWDSTQPILEHPGPPSGLSPSPSPEQAAILQVKVDMLTAQLEREKETVEDLRRRLDRAEDRLLSLSPPKEAEVKPKRFWTWLMGR